MKISIVYFSPFPRKSGHTASDRRIRDFVRGLIHAGHNVNLLVPLYHNRFIDFNYTKEFEIIYIGKKSDYLPFFLKRILFNYYLYSYIIKSKTNCLFLYNSQIDSIPLIKRIRKKNIFVINEICDLHSDSSSQSLKSSLSRYHEKFLSKNTDVFITISSYLSSLLLRINPKCKVITIPILVDTDVFRPIPDLYNSRISINNEFIITYAGNMWKHQGVSDLIESFAMLINNKFKVKLVIAGNYEYNKNYDDVKTLVDKHGISNNVFLPGWLNTNQLVELLNNSDLLVIPQKKQNFTIAGFPTKLAEYAACKKPILITRVGDINDYFIHENNCFLCEPDNTTDMYMTMKYIIQNPQIRETVANNAYLLAKSKFCYKANGEIISMTLNNVLEEVGDNRI